MVEEYPTQLELFLLTIWCFGRNRIFYKVHKYILLIRIYCFDIYKRLENHFSIYIYDKKDLLRTMGMIQV